MPISTSETITNLIPYDVAFAEPRDSAGMLLPVLRSQGVARCRVELVESPVTADIASITGGTPVKNDACTLFFCTDFDGSVICRNLPKTEPGHFLLVTEEIAKRANQHKLFRGIIFPRKYTIIKREDTRSKRDLMVITQLGTFWYTGKSAPSPG